MVKKGCVICTSRIVDIKSEFGLELKPLIWSQKLVLEGILVGYLILRCLMFIASTGRSKETVDCNISLTESFFFLSALT